MNGTLEIDMATGYSVSAVFVSSCAPHITAARSAAFLGATTDMRFAKCVVYRCVNSKSIGQEWGKQSSFQ